MAGWLAGWSVLCDKWQRTLRGFEGGQAPDLQVTIGCLPASNCMLGDHSMKVGTV